jgi:hypothetical protein
MNNYKLIEYKSDMLLRDLTRFLSPPGLESRVVYYSSENSSVTTKLYLEESCLLGYGAAWSVGSQPASGRNILPLLTPVVVLASCSPYN